MIPEIYFLPTVLVALFILTVISLLLNIWQMAAAQKMPLHRAARGAGSRFTVSILKPLKGVDPDTRRALESWFHQGASEVLFGVADENDPVCPLARNLITQYPLAKARLVICPKSLGANAKVSTLIQLAAEAKGDVLAVSDADVEAPENLLHDGLSNLDDPQVGLVHCFYQLPNTQTFPMRLEAFAMNADFWSQVAQASTLRKVEFALGASMFIRRTALEQIGGFEAVADYLADDYHLGNKMAKSSLKVEFANLVVRCLEPVKKAGAIWSHQLRWHRTVRVSQPAPFFFSVLSNATIWPLWLSSANSTRETMFLFIAALFVRIDTARRNYNKLTNSTRGNSQCFLAPIKDLLGFVLWAFAFLGDFVEWRGQRYKVLADGKLQPLN